MPYYVCAAVQFFTYCDPRTSSSQEDEELCVSRQASIFLSMATLFFRCTRSILSRVEAMRGLGWLPRDHAQGHLIRSVLLS